MKSDFVCLGGLGQKAKALKRKRSSSSSGDVEKETNMRTQFGVLKGKVENGEKGGEREEYYKELVALQKEEIDGLKALLERQRTIWEEQVKKLGSGDDGVRGPLATRRDLLEQMLGVHEKRLKKLNGKLQRQKRESLGELWTVKKGQKEDKTKKKIGDLVVRVRELKESMIFITEFLSELEVENEILIKILQDEGGNHGGGRRFFSHLLNFFSLS